MAIAVQHMTNANDRSILMRLLDFAVMSIVTARSPRLVCRTLRMNQVNETEYVLSFKENLTIFKRKKKSGW